MTDIFVLQGIFIIATIFLDMTVNVLSHITYRLTISIHFLKKNTHGKSVWNFCRIFTQLLLS